MSSPINNHLKCKWIIFGDQKIQSGQTDWKTQPNICCFQETQIIIENKHRLKVKGWKIIFQTNSNWKEVSVAILISEKEDFKTKTIKDKEEQT